MYGNEGNTCNRGDSYTLRIKIIIRMGGLYVTRGGDMQVCDGEVLNMKQSDVCKAENFLGRSGGN